MPARVSRKKTTAPAPPRQRRRKAPERFEPGGPDDLTVDELEDPGFYAREIENEELSDLSDEAEFSDDSFVVSDGEEWLEDNQIDTDGEDTQTVGSLSETTSEDFTIYSEGASASASGSASIDDVSYASDDYGW